jgi:2Fe-2S ferredoxin
LTASVVGGEKMPKLIVKALDGAERVLNVESNQSVMEGIRNAGIGELLAMCGGCRSCATCHVYVDEAFWGKLPPMSDDENSLLDGTLDRRSFSRLSCQIQMSQELDGLAVMIAEA